MCLGVLSLHDMRILHRDLKTQNIFLTRKNDVRIGDFGLAKLGTFRESPIIRSSRPYNFEVENTSKVGTPFYLAPELCYEETCLPYTVKSDVWALGIILYELCALRKPFNAENETELYIRITNDKIAPIKNISIDLMNLISKMLSKDPGRRPTIRQVIDSDYIRSRAFLLKIDLPKRLQQTRQIQSSRPNLTVNPQYIRPALATTNLQAMLKQQSLLTPKQANSSLKYNRTAFKPQNKPIENVVTPKNQPLSHVNSPRRIKYLKSATSHLEMEKRAKNMIREISMSKKQNYLLQNTTRLMSKQSKSS